jgi:hypothetical protein
MLYRILDHITDNIIIFDKQYNIKYANKAWLRHTNHIFNRNDICIGMNFINDIDVIKNDPVAIIQVKEPVECLLRSDEHIMYKQMEVFGVIWDVMYVNLNKENKDVLIIARDITTLYLTIKQLEIKHNSHKLFVDNIHIQIKGLLLKLTSYCDNIIINQSTIHLIVKCAGDILKILDNMIKSIETNIYI